MPSAWSEKRERQYEEIKQSELERGHSTKRAKEIAARTVNKQRRKAGETQEGKGNGRSKSNGSGSEQTKDELYSRASQMEIKGRSKMTKAELATAIRRHG